MPMDMFIFPSIIRYEKYSNSLCATVGWICEPIHGVYLMLELLISLYFVALCENKDAK